MPRMSERDYGHYCEYLEQKREMEEFPDREEAPMLPTYDEVIAEIEAEAETRRVWLRVEQDKEIAWWGIHDSLVAAGGGDALETHLDLREDLSSAAIERMQTITLEEFRGLSRYARYAVMHLAPWLTPIPGPPARGGS